VVQTTHQWVVDSRPVDDGKQPFLHLVSDLCRSADECEPAKATDALRELPHRQVLALCQLDDSLASTLADKVAGLPEM